MIFTGLLLNSMKSRKVFIIGHRGFIGSEIFNQIKTKIDKLEGYSTKELDLTKPKSLVFLKEKLTKDTILIITASINREMGDSIENMQIHIDMLINLAQILKEVPIKKCVYLSSIDVYGYPSKLPINENSPVNPQTYYGIAKLTCEKLLSKVCKETDIPLLILRYNGIFGSGQKITGYGLNNFIKSIIDQQKVNIWGDGNEKRDPVYVVDLARIIINLTLGKAEGIFNIASGKSLSFKQMINVIRKISPKKFKIAYKKRTSPPFNQKYDIKKLKEYLPDLKFMPLDKAIQETFIYYQNQYEKGETLKYA